MLFTEENLKNIKVTKNGRFRDFVTRSCYYYFYACNVCGYPHLNIKKDSKYCTRECAYKSEERNKKISITNTGRIFSEQHKQKLSIPKSEQHKQKISKRMSGKKHPFYDKKRPEHSAKLKGRKKPEQSIRIKGNGNPMFGRTGKSSPAYIDGRWCDKNDPYCTQWNDKEYKHYLLYERDGRCFGPECDKKYLHKLVLHHINYIKKDCRPNNLVGLCVSCNGKANYDREWHEAYYTVLMKKRGLNKNVEN